MFKSILLLNLVHRLVLSSVKSNVIETTTGPVRGKLNYHGEISYKSYEGIPFAEPPLGDLRFKPPVPVRPWKHILDATTPGYVCPQVVNTHQRSEMSEDCLFLNIYVPTIKSSDPFPLVFFIHGGYYIVNSGKPKPIYGPELILEKGVIEVTTNYRLGALGFLSFENIHASGNAGLKDIILASRWVKSNIKKFGGDPSRICLFGMGAGGALVHHLLLTKQISGIFQNAIMTSGSAIGYRNLQINAKDNALKLARELGIKYTDDNCLNELKEIDAFDIVEAETNIISNDPREAFVLVNLFAPAVEQPSPIALITRNPLDVIRTEGLVQKIPVIAGWNNHEGIEIFSVVRSNPNAVNLLNEDFELCIPPNIQYPFGSQERKDLAKSIREFYFNGGNITIFNTQNYINLITDTAYAYSMDYWINLHTSRESCSPVYYYIFKFDGQLNWGKLSAGVTYPGTARADELGYVFLTDVTRNIIKKLNHKTKYVLECVLTLLKNFVTYGDPTPRDYERMKWTETSSKDRSHMVLDDFITNVAKSPFQERLQFWYKEYAKYYEYEQKRSQKELCL